MANQKNGNQTLPQVNAGNVETALQLIRSIGPDQVVDDAWLEAHDISQPVQTRALLRFLGVLDSSRRPTEAILACRDDAEQFIERLRECTIEAYAEAGCGGRETLKWLGRDNLDKRALRARVGGWPRFKDHGVTRGGHKNAFYCVCALHDRLLDHRWLDGAAAVRESNSSAKSDAPSRKDASAPSPNNDPSTTESDWNVQFTVDGRGDRLVARIRIDAASQPEQLIKLGRLLQNLGEVAAEED
ncbi:MAG: hypothetical protein JW888_17245 [Pirellulales bacterium]|nr:hypothetical protein [Pirellulales bacterium]